MNEYLIPSLESIEKQTGISLAGIKTQIREQQKEIERLHSIIKEAREYIESFKKVFEGHYPFVDIRGLDLNKLLEILDKVGGK